MLTSVWNSPVTGVITASAPIRRASPDSVVSRTTS
jgi:hypothetical protein